jgi:hypothetical protein
MNSWLLIAIAAMLLLLMTLREHYVEREGPGERPSFDGAEGAAWRSKIDAQIPIGGSDDDYMTALQKFYDTIYSPMRTANKTASPKDTEVETFLDGLTIPNISKDALRQIILSGFSIDKTLSAAAREQKQVKFQPTEALQPRDGVDQVYGRRKEEVYVPADKRIGELPEGIYAPTPQTEPIREGIWDDKSTSWSPAAFASVCEGGKCAQNVL